MAVESVAVESAAGERVAVQSAVVESVAVDSVAGCSVWLERGAVESCCREGLSYSHAWANARNAARSTAAALTCDRKQSLHELKVFLAILVYKRSCANAHTPF